MYLQIDNCIFVVVPQLIAQYPINRVFVIGIPGRALQLIC